MSKLEKYLYIFSALLFFGLLVRIGEAVNKQITLYQNTGSIEHLVPIILACAFIEVVVVGYSYQHIKNSELRYPKIWAFVAGITFGLSILLQKMVEDHYWRKEGIKNYKDNQSSKSVTQNNKLEQNEEDIGYVYILVNSSIPGQVKIGMTRNTPKHRAKQMNKTGVPTPFVVAYKRKVVDPYEVEQEIHRILSEYRTNPNREFFTIETGKAIDTLNNYLKNNPNLIR